MNITKKESNEIYKKVKNTIILADKKLNFPNKISSYGLNIVYIQSERKLGSAQIAFDDDYKGGALLILRINIDAYRQNKDAMLNDTIPHEIAHFICMVNYMEKKIKPHGKEWKAVCSALGGSPKALANEQDFDRSLLVSKRKSKKFLYILDNGYELELTSVRHNKIMKGTVYSLNEALVEKRHFKKAL